MSNSGLGARIERRRFARTRSSQLISAELLEIRRMLTTYVVNSILDFASPPTGSTVTLRGAIQAVNADTGPDTIDFNIGGGGAWTIALTAALPAMTTPVTLDATSQPGYAGTPLITIDGAAAGAMTAGLEVSGGNSTVEGLQIQHIQQSGFNLPGYAILADFQNSDTVQNCVIVNNGNGIDWETQGSSYIQHNYIGTDAAGDTGLGNNGDGISFGAINFTGASVSILNNVISGNAFNGIDNPEPNGAFEVIQGNIIGLNPAGTAALPNGNYGILNQQGVGGLIGGTTAAQRNIISGNLTAGINVDGGSGPTIEGNYIGTDITGSVVIANQQNGFESGPGGGGLLINNVIDGGTNCILVTNGFTSIQGNYIGTDATGNVALGNQNEGVEIDSTSEVVLGGVTPGAGNVISGNFFNAIEVGQDSTHITIEGNKIGTNAAGTAIIGSRFEDIRMVGSNNLIGGSLASEANIIAGGTVGIELRAGTGNAIRLNSIFGNGIGIAFALNTPSESGDYGLLTPNDPNDADGGANNQQNFPVITSAMSQGGVLTIQGVLNTNPNTVLLIDFYSSNSLDSSGMGEGQTYLGTTSVTTDAFGNAAFKSKLSVSAPIGTYVTAVATTIANSPYGDSSEFSAAVQVSGPPLPTLSVGNYSHAEGNSGTTIFSFPVTLSAASSSPVSVSYTTQDGSATVADHDYTAASSTLTIPAGSTTGTINVSVLGDTKLEADETFILVLSSPSGATLATASGTGTIQNDDSTPTVSIGSVSLNEGNSGLTTFAFPLTLSNASSAPIMVSYTTVDGTAQVSDNDYVAASGVFTIPANTTSTSINISVVGDTKLEPTEAFTVKLSSPSGATLTTASTGTGTIVNDDGMPSVSIGDVSMNEGNSGTTVFAFPVTLSNPSSSDITVHYATANGTATTSDHDYTAASGTLTIPAGAVSGVVNVSITGDTKVESNETFTVKITSPTNSTISRATATGTIVNDDQPPPLFNAHVNFEPANIAVPSGYVADIGQVFGSRGSGLSYGWNANNTANTRIRNVNSDSRLDTLIYMQQGGNFSWSITVPNGTYSVHLVAGDPSNFNSAYRINVNGSLAVNGTPTSSKRFIEGTKTINVTNSKIMVSNDMFAFNDKLDYIDITETAASSSSSSIFVSSTVTTAFSPTTKAISQLDPADDVLSRL